jgi:hypothetical protein
VTALADISAEVPHTTRALLHAVAEYVTAANQHAASSSCATTSGSRPRSAAPRSPASPMPDPDGELAWREIDGVDGAVRFFREGRAARRHDR